MTHEKLFDSIYFDPNKVGSLGGVDSLFKAAKEKNNTITRKNVLDYLKKQDTYTLHKPYYKHYSRRKIIVGSIDKQWQADLVDMNSVLSDNNGFRYILTVIDCFSKYAWAVPLKNKSGSLVLEAFENIFKMAQPRMPIRLQTDKGKEFFNPQLKELFRKKNIFHFASNSDQKAAIVERFNRTLKSKMWRYFTAKNTRKYIDILAELINSYNKSFHRSIGMAPHNVRKKDELKIWQKMYPHSSILKNRSEPSLNSNVRISKIKHVFEKGYLPNWTEEYFKVSEKNLSKAPTIYKLKDLKGDPIQGVFLSKRNSTN